MIQKKYLKIFSISFGNMSLSYNIWTVFKDRLTETTHNLKICNNEEIMFLHCFF
jgi:hypothetical protein